MATITDVARRAGVSVSTVSYALSGARPISAPTRERIERAMAELGYTPNALARGLRGKRSKIIALLCPTIGRSIDLSGLEYILGASDHAQASGYHLLLWTTEADAIAELRSLAAQGLLDGALVMEVKLEDPRIDLLIDAGLPFAMIGRPRDASGLDYVDTDFDQCAQVAVEHLVTLGHRHLAFINQSPEAVGAGVANAVRLREAVEACAADAGVQVTSLSCENSLEGGHAAFGELMHADSGVSAVIALNEQAVAGLMSAAVAAGRQIPESLSVVSIALTPQAAGMTTPSMTTVGPSARDMGRVGVELLIRRLDNRATSPSQQLFAGELIVRGTSAPPAAVDGATRTVQPAVAGG